MTGIEYVVEESHKEGGVTVVDRARVTGASFSGRGRTCLCRRCHDFCITVTRSEMCSDCEWSTDANPTPCHT